MPCLLNVNLCTSSSVCMHVSKMLIIVHVVLLGGERERERGRER